MPPVMVRGLQVIGALAALITGLATIAPPPAVVTTAVTSLVLAAVYLLAAGSAHIHKTAKPKHWLRSAFVFFGIGLVAFITYLVVRSRLIFEYPGAPDQVKGLWVRPEVAEWLGKQEADFEPKHSSGDGWGNVS